MNGTAIRLDDFALHDLSSLKAFDVSKVTYVGKHAMQNCICVDFSYACLRNITHIGEFGLANAIHTVKGGVWYELNEQLFTDVEKNAFAGCEVAGFIMKTSLAELDEALSAKIGQSIIPVSTDPSDIVQKYHVLKDWLGVACDFEMILDDFVLNAKGNGLDYSCFIYNNSRDEIVDLKVNADLQKFIDMPVFPSRAKSIAYNALNVDIFKKSI